MVSVPEAVTVGELAERMNKPAAELMGNCENRQIPGQTRSLSHNKYRS